MTISRVSPSSVQHLNNTKGIAMKLCVGVRGVHPISLQLFLCRCAHLHIHVTWATLFMFIVLIPYFYFICGIWSHLIYILFVHFLILTCYYHVQGPSFFYFYLSIWCFLNVCFPKFVVITCGQPIWENIKKKRNEEKGHTRQIILWLTICYCYKTDEKLEKWFIKCTFIFVWP